MFVIISALFIIKLSKHAVFSVPKFCLSSFMSFYFGHVNEIFVFKLL